MSNRRPSRGPNSGSKTRDRSARPSGPVPGPAPGPALGQTKIDRRAFTAMAGASVGAFALFKPSVARAQTPRVVVIGGGAGGATAARYLAKDSKGGIDVTLIEPQRTYFTCFYSNLYLGGFRSYDSIAHTYEKLAIDHGINVVHDYAVAIDRDKKTVRLGSGPDVPYDALVVSPGIELKYDSVPGYSLAASKLMPHAYKSGTQVAQLRHMVMNMREGGTFLMVAPPNPYRCPPGPYERVSMIAHLLKRNNPSAKIIILDPKEKFSKQALFQEGWETHYPGMVNWIPASIYGEIESVNPETGEFTTGFDDFKADVASIIPAQTAGSIAIKSGLTDESGWCPIDPASMRSTLDENIYVLGDSSIAGAMPKSAFSANSQAKVAVMAIRHKLTGTRLFPARYANSCWSLIGENDGVKVGGRYQPGEALIETVNSFISQTEEPADLRKATYEESIDWYNSIVADMFG